MVDVAAGLALPAEEGLRIALVEKPRRLDRERLPRERIEKDRPAPQRADRDEFHPGSIPRFTKASLIAAASASSWLTPSPRPATSVPSMSVTPIGGSASPGRRSR